MNCVYEVILNIMSREHAHYLAFMDLSLVQARRVFLQVSKQLSVRDASLTGMIS